MKFLVLAGDAQLRADAGS